MSPVTFKYPWLTHETFPSVDLNDFDVSSQTGFMPPHIPLGRLPEQWELWELLLYDAISSSLQLGEKAHLSLKELTTSERWRRRVREIHLISTENLRHSIVKLRRAHLVLAFILHFYVQTLPPNVAISIPRSIGIPLLQVSSYLDVPPLLTFADTVLYNWELTASAQSPSLSLDDLRSHTMFTNLPDEEAFYLSSARIELRGVQAINIIQMTMDEISVGDSDATGRITTYLERSARVIDDLKLLLLDVKNGCNPDIYYNEVRPWFSGEDSDLRKRRWVFEGIEDYPALRTPTELSGPSAGQSSLIHLLDVFLGVENKSASSCGKPSFLKRMQSYMPRKHRLFLDHIASASRPLRQFVLETNDPLLLASYNRAVRALKEFRDAHMIIATLYIIGPSRRAARSLEGEKAEFGSGVVTRHDASLKGTGGTDLVKFLKDVRNRTSKTLIG